MGVWVNGSLSLWVYEFMDLYVSMFMAVDLSPALPVSVKTKEQGKVYGSMGHEMLVLAQACVANAHANAT